jgi:methylated-DNA-[protein]-cysteine S-methyltransferase
MPKSSQPVVAPPVYYRWLDSPLGELLLTANEIALTALALKGQKYFPKPTPAWQLAPSLAILNQAQTQLQAYFAGKRQTFDLPLAPQGTAFQQQVWHYLCDIPFGETRTYAQLARAIAQPSAVRAVGAANGRNPISIIVPCHRVIASDGTLTGYAGGLDHKQWLLNHEQQKGQLLQGDLFA